MLPDIIMYTEHGFGNSYLLGLLAEYIDTKRTLMDFSGDVKLLEFAMSYCPPEKPFNELTRLMNSIRVVAGYRNEYKGLVRISSDQWVGHHSEKYFFELMEYLAAYTNNWMIVVTLSDNWMTKQRNWKLRRQCFCGLKLFMCIFQMLKILLNMQMNIWGNLELVLTNRRWSC